jgi:hypothetical protein
MVIRIKLTQQKSLLSRIDKSLPFSASALLGFLLLGIRNEMRGEGEGEGWGWDLGKESVEK